jgi:hypothetical protein
VGVSGFVVGVAFQVGVPALLFCPSSADAPLNRKATPINELLEKSNLDAFQHRTPWRCKIDSASKRANSSRSKHILPITTPIS